MNIDEFKKNLDSRQYYKEKHLEMWEAASKWQSQANTNENALVKWSWDCGLKLDYDGGIISISSRFYPPHKSSEDYGKYHGTVSVLMGDDYLFEKEIEANTLDDLKTTVEDYVAKANEKICNAVKLALTE